MEISEAKFICILKRGARCTADFMAQLTDYHGGPTKTEYILTVDIARAFQKDKYEVQVEFLNRKIVNGLTKRKDWTERKKLGSQRTDVAVMNAGIVPQAIVEIKIGVGGTLYKIKDDLEKILNTIEGMEADFASRVRAAAVFQVYVPGRSKDPSLDHLKRRIKKIETSLEENIETFAKNWSEFNFRLVPLQGDDEGFTATETEIEEDGTKALGQNGHATRYYAIIITCRRGQSQSKLA